MLSELLYADDLVLMSETIDELRYRFIEWKEAFWSNGLKFSLGKNRVIISDGITMDGLSKSNVDSCWVFSLRLNLIHFCANNVTSVYTVDVLECNGLPFMKFCLHEM